MKHVIVFPDNSFLSENGLKIIKSLGSVFTYNDIPKTDQEIIKRIQHADIIIPSKWVNIDADIIDNALKLRFIIVPSVGYEWIDVKYAAKKGIKTLNCPTSNSEAVANHTITLILSLTRRIKEADIQLQNGRWRQIHYTGMELRNKTLGLVGYGKIGQRVGEIARMFGMRVKYVDSKKSETELDSLLSTCDIVSLHLPLNEKTEKIINGNRINLMKKGAYLINVSRGGLVDQKALIKALKSGKLGGAGLDVFEDEPSQSDETNISDEIVELAKMPNVIATPHIAFNTKETFVRLEEEVILDIKSCIDGNPINVIGVF